MKKLIYTAILLAGFQFAQAQQVTAIGVPSTAGTIISLDGAIFDAPMPPPSVPLQLVLEITNTGNDNLSRNDMITFVFLLNDSVMVESDLTLASAFPTGGVFITPATSIPLITACIKSGENANQLCVQIPSITVGGVQKAVNSEYCASFTASVVGIEDIGHLKEVNIFPNPVRDNYLKFENLNEATNIYLYNIAGQLIESIPAATGNIDMDVSHLSNGVYVTKLQSGKYTHTKKIQIIR
jgi:hypothetical protein